MKYIVVAPTEREYRNITLALQERETKNQYTVIRSGVGKALAAANTALAIARAKGDVERIAVIGYAASTLGRKRGEIVAPRVARYHDCRIPGDFVPELTDPYPLLGHDDAVVWTGDSFVDAKIISEVKSQYAMKSGLFDMEATAVCQVAEMFDLPIVVVKMVSDVPEEGDNEHSYDEFVDSHSDFGVFIDYLESLR
jgi:nucleoside phosphorylase